MKKKREDRFNPIFKDSDLKIESQGEEGKSPPSRPPATAENPPEEDRFLVAMAGVKPLQESKKKAVRGRGVLDRPSHPPPDDQREGVAHLRAIVKGSVEIDITFSDEYIEGFVKGFSRRLMKRLKRGEIPVQDYVDLHGLTRLEAEIEVRGFLLRSYKTGLRCVLIVHGRGLNSPDSFPVLKEGLPVWLNRGSIRKIVLAFVTARPFDGGTGAVYVLLRKR